MSNAEKFIEEHTRSCSNLVYKDTINGKEFNTYNYWLTPDQALKAVEIARKEVMDKVCDYIKNNLYKHLYVYDGHAGFPTYQFIEDLKQAIENE